MPTQPLRSFRLVCKPEQAPLVERLLKVQGFTFEPEPFFSLARRLTGGRLPLGASLAAAFGYIYIQDRSSMLPPLALAPEPGAAVLDMCASPGSKTGLLAQLAGPEGFVLANEPSPKRLLTLRRNLQSLNLFNCATSAYPGERLPLHPGSALPLNGLGGEEYPGWKYVQLDPPCSGWGTVEKNPQVLRLWQGNKLGPLIGLQRKLLTEAARLLRPGGRLAYSTCTTNCEENEAQLRFAREELGLEFLPLEALPGFGFADPALPEFAGSWRIKTGSDGQGFFVALLQKPGPALTPDRGENTPDSSGDKVIRDHEDAPFAAPAFGENAKNREQTCFARPWEKDSRQEGRRPRHARGKKKPACQDISEVLSRDALAGAYLDPDLLPPGDIAVCNGVAHFMPKQSRMLAEQGFAWKGFALGRVSAAARFGARLNRLMPPVETLGQKGLLCLNLEDPAPILDLMAGRSLPVDLPGPETGLYFCGLPLCRLSIKGKRAVLGGASV